MAAVDVGFDLGGTYESIDSLGGQGHGEGAEREKQDGGRELHRDDRSHSTSHRCSHSSLQHGSHSSSYYRSHCRDYL
jgi:hypothetical protein